jgi:hypothetical protein
VGRRACEALASRSQLPPAICCHACFGVLSLDQRVRKRTRLRHVLLCFPLRQDLPGLAGKDAPAQRGCERSPYLSETSTERSAGLKSPHFSKEGVLLPGNDDLFVVGEHESDARTIKKARLLDVHEVNNAIARRPKERRRIQPALTFSKRSPQNYRTSRHGDARSTAESFEKPDVGCPDQPALPLAAQEDKVIGTQDVFMLFYDGAGRLTWLQLLQSSGLWRGHSQGRRFGTTFPGEPICGGATGIVEFHGS